MTSGDLESPIPQINIMTSSDDVSYGSGSIRTTENRILFYYDITSESCLELNKCLMDMDLKIQTLKLSLGGDYKPTIHLHIQSPGGEIYPAFSTVDTIKSMNTDVYTYVDGLAASAATLISCVGKKRFIGKYGYMLVHELSTVLYGKFSDLEGGFNDTKKLMKVLKDFYKENTKIPMKRLEEILKHDLYLSAQECLDYGLVDEIR